MINHDTTLTNSWILVINSHMKNEPAENCIIEICGKIFRRQMIDRELVDEFLDRYLIDKRSSAGDRLSSRNFMIIIIAFFISVILF